MAKNSKRAKSANESQEVEGKEHFNTACQNRRNEEDNAKKHNATIAGMKRNMEAFLKKSGSRGGDQESQSDGRVMWNVGSPEGISAGNDSDRDLELDNIFQDNCPKAAASANEFGDVAQCDSDREIEEFNERLKS